MSKKLIKFCIMCMHLSLHFLQLPISYVRQSNCLIIPNIAVSFKRPPQSDGLISKWFYLDQIKSKRSAMCTILVVEKAYLEKHTMIDIANALMLLFLMRFLERDICRKNTSCPISYLYIMIITVLKKTDNTEQ